MTTGADPKILAVGFRGGASGRRRPGDLGESPRGPGI